MAKCCIYPGICSGNWSKQQECPASETGGFSDTDITYLWQVSHHITCDCWNVWHLWLSHLKYKVHFLKPSVSMVQKWLTTLKPKYQSYVLVLYAFRSRFGAEALQSNGLTLKRGEWWICVNLAFPLQAPGCLVPSTSQSVSGENPASWKLPPRHRDFLLPRPCHCLRWTILVRFNWISHPQ